MAIIEKRGRCPIHGDVLARANTPNHILHLLLTVVTGGLWVVVWLWLSIGPKSWRCPSCGRSTGSGLLNDIRNADSKPAYIMLGVVFLVAIIASLLVRS